MHHRLCIFLLGLACSARADEFTYKGTPRAEAPVVAWTNGGALHEPGDRIRVASYNIENFTDGVGDDPDRTLDRVQNQARNAATLLNEISADVVLLMEVENTNSLRVLNAALNPPYPQAYITHLGDGAPDEQKLNLAVLSRLPVAEVRETDFGLLTGPGRPTRGFLRVVLDLGGQQRLVLYAVHLKSNFGFRPRNIAQRQHTLELIAADAQALADSDASMDWEMLVAGDTNVDPELPEFADDSSFAPLKDWKDLWRGRPLAERTTLPTRYGDPALEFPPACFDRLFASRTLAEAPWQVGEPHTIPRGVVTQRVNAKPGEGDHVSDHYPIYVDITR